jgi:formylglycine-generating enzyme required for sulfatase activity
VKLPVHVTAPTGGPDGGGVDFHIDATEVTVARYSDFVTWFLANKPAQRDVCYWNQSVVPNVAPANDAGITPSAECSGYALDVEVAMHPNVPVRCIDWCDAAAYCTWSGGWMCHGNEGKPYPVEWANACASAAGDTYPYGNTYVAHACVDSPAMGPADVATHAQCVGGFPGVYDMSGNVGEWLDCGCEYDNADATKTSAYVGGGSYEETGSALSCPPVRSAPLPSFNADVGIRCCYP